jgi:signal transduction histidine kinase
MEDLNSKEIEIKTSDKERHIVWLKEMMFFISHKLRQPVTTIMGLSNMLNSKFISRLEMKKILQFIKQCALSLDKLTRDISSLVYEKIIKLNKGTHQKKL